MSESPNWSSKPQEPMKRVRLECEGHGELGEMDREFIGQAEIEHRDIYGCYYPLIIIPLIDEELKGGSTK